MFNQKKKRERKEKKRNVHTQIKQNFINAKWYQWQKLNNRRLRERINKCVLYRFENVQIKSFGGNVKTYTQTRPKTRPCLRPVESESLGVGFAHDV